MKLELEKDKYEPCAPKIFKVNDIYADPDDFGEVDKILGYYCCESRKFIGFEEPPAGILGKYQITEDEFFEICDELRDILRVKDCSMCV